MVKITEPYRREVDNNGQLIYNSRNLQSLIGSTFANLAIFIHIIKRLAHLLF